MMTTLYYIILVPMVYIAVAVFIVGTIISLLKLFRTPKHPSPLQIYPEKRPKWFWTLHDVFLLPTVRKHSPLLWVFLMAFHLCLLLIIVGHLELFRSFAVFQIIPHAIPPGNGFAGLVMCIALLFFLFRRFVSPYRDLSVPEDYYLLILLLLTALFGSQLDWARSWYDYGELDVADYREYLLSMVYLKPEIPDTLLSTGHSFMLAAHVFFANLFLLFFPFSKVMHSFLTLPINKLRRG